MPRLICLALALGLAGCAPDNVPVGSNRGGAQGGGAGVGGGTTTTAVGLGCTPVTLATGVATALPVLAELTGVSGCVAGDAVKVRFDPVDGAKDYRIYALPTDADIAAAADGHLSVRNALYRCAGQRMAPAPLIDAVSGASGGTRTLVDGRDVGGYVRTLAEATLGHVYVTPGEGRTAVYALGDPDPAADNGCYYGRWAESRVKKYTASADERAQLIAQRWRDDGIAFYAPQAADSTTTQVSTSVSRDATRFYFTPGPEAQLRGTAEPAFAILAAPAPGTVPLMRVFYQNLCGRSHDELAAGPERFARAYRQGNQPAWELRWSGLTGPTTLVVEALDQPCPWPGMLAPLGKPGYGDYPPWLTLAEASAAAATGEVFVNGQGEGTNPRPLARTFLTVAPSRPAGLDWFDGFAPGTALAPFTDAPCGATPGNTCWQQFRRVSSDYDSDFMFTETNRNGFGQVLGELWVGLADVAAGVNGKFRLTPRTRARMSADAFLYVTLETDTLTTVRRYPQLILSDLDPPLDWSFAQGHSLIVQSNPTVTQSWPNQLRVQLCDRRMWEESSPCPGFPDLHAARDPNDPTLIRNLAPGPEVAEHSGLDRATQWEVYASTRRIYLFLDGQPYGCADLPAGAPAGPVSVTFGYVLSHSSIDDMSGLSDFLMRHGQIESHRHFDNLGFASDVQAPAWNEAILPCAGANQLGH